MIFPQMGKSEIGLYTSKGWEMFQNIYIFEK